MRFRPNQISLPCSSSPRRHGDAEEILRLIPQDRLRRSLGKAGEPKTKDKSQKHGGNGRRRDLVVALPVAPSVVIL